MFIKMNRFTPFFISLILPVTGCATSYIQPSATIQSSENVQLATNVQHTAKVKLVNIHALEVKDKTLRLQVMSNGCTKAESFKLIWQGDNLTVQRVKPDHCRRMPHKIWLKFEIPTQISNFNMVNKFER